jgi:hypothetical protein
MLHSKKADPLNPIVEIHVYESLQLRITMTGPAQNQKNGKGKKWLRVVLNELLWTGNMQFHRKEHKKGVVKTPSNYQLSIINYQLSIVNCSPTHESYTP